jgi:hypothetical protein
MRQSIDQGYRLLLAGMDVDRLSEDYRRCREAFVALGGGQAGKGRSACGEW